MIRPFHRHVCDPLIVRCAGHGFAVTSGSCKECGTYKLTKMLGAKKDQERECAAMVQPSRTCGWYVAHREVYCDNPGAEIKSVSPAVVTTDLAACLGNLDPSCGVYRG